MITDKQLATWISNQRKLFLEGNLDSSKIKILESVPGWAWKAYEARWAEGFNQLKKYPTAGRKFITPDGYRLGFWIQRQRQAHYRGTLPEDKIKLMESVSGFVWDVHDSIWTRNLNLSKKMGSVVHSVRTKNDVPIGKWQAKQRLLYRQKKLSKEKISLLKTIPNWKWSYSNKERIQRMAIGRARKAKKN